MSKGIEANLKELPTAKTGKIWETKQIIIVPDHITQRKKE